MLTIGTTPRAFRGRTGLRQRNALLSWLQIEPEPEIILFGAAPGIETVAARFGLRHEVAPLPNTPSSARKNLQEAASRTLITHLSPDVILIAGDCRTFLSGGDPDAPDVVTARSWYLPLVTRVDVARHWQPLLRRRLAEKGHLHRDRRNDIVIWPADASPADARPSVIGDVSIHLTAVRQEPVAEETGDDLPPPTRIRGMTGWRRRSGLAEVIDRLRSRDPAEVRHVNPADGQEGDEVAALFDGDATAATTAATPEENASQDGLSFSVVVCTYNRADLLPACLESLRRQTLEASDFEVIVVDNNSSDDTSETVRQAIAAQPNLHLLFEPAQGLSHARNCGWRAAKGRYVAYIDDEIRPPDDWLDNARRLIAESAPDIFGGPYIPGFEGRPPPWMRAPYFSSWKGRQRRQLREGQYISGGNLFVRRDLFTTIGGFDPELGMKGMALGYGEEVDFQKRLRMAEPNGRIVYEPSLLVEQLTRAGKATILEILRSRLAGGASAEVMKPAAPSSRRALAPAAFGSLRALTWSTAVRSRLLYPYPQNYWMEGGLRDLQDLGRAWARLSRPPVE